MQTFIFDLDDLLHDIAEQYTKGKIDTNQYVALLNELAAAPAAGNNLNTITI